MKLSISISSFIARVANNFLPIGNVMVKGVMVHTVASSFSASLQLTNDHMALVSNIAHTANLWVLIGKYKSPHCVLTLLSSG